MLVNGQTGEVVSGPIPTSWLKVGLLVVLILIVIGLAVVAVLGLGTAVAAVSAMVGALSGSVR
jgi:hypothetical protein